MLGEGLVGRVFIADISTIMGRCQGLHREGEGGGGKPDPVDPYSAPPRLPSCLLPPFKCQHHGRGRSSRTSHLTSSQNNQAEGGVKLLLQMRGGWGHSAKHE